MRKIQDALNKIDDKYRRSSLDADRLETAIEAIEHVRSYAVSWDKELNDLQASNGVLTIARDKSSDIINELRSKVALLEQKINKTQALASLGEKTLADMVRDKAMTMAGKVIATGRDEQIKFLTGEDW